MSSAPEWRDRSAQLTRNLDPVASRRRHASCFASNRDLARTAGSRAGQGGRRGCNGFGGDD